MLGFIQKVYQQILDWIVSLNPARKAALAILGVVVIGGMIAMINWAGKTSYGQLMANLSPEDATNIISILREKKIPFRIDPSGKNIETPPEYIDQLRMELATMGLPQSGGVGYEIFDRQAIGVTSFVQQVNRKRALEGEITRTVLTIRGVKKARVHLALPKQSTFIEDQRPPTASVVLDLEIGSQLSEKQVYGIGVLVARAVEGMDVNDVVVVDSTGKVLSKNKRDSMVAVTAEQFDYQKRLEEDLESRVMGILGRVVGEGGVTAKVTAELDFSRVVESQTTYDPEGATVVSQQKNEAQSDGSRPSPMGQVGAKANTPIEEPASADNALVKTATKQSDERKNFKVPQTVKNIQKPLGSIKRISVAVLIDGKRTKTEKEDGTVESKVEAWPPEKIEEFKQIISRTVGIDEKRGDTLDIKNIEFHQEDFAEAERQLAAAERRSYIKNIIVYLVIALAIGLFFFVVVRPFIKWVTENTIESVDTFLPQTIEELEKIQKTTNVQQLEEIVPVLPDRVDPEKVEGEMMKEKIITLVDGNPQKAALVLRDWVKVSKNSTEAGEKTAGKG